MKKHGGKRIGAGRKHGAVASVKLEIAQLAKEHGESAISALVEIASKGTSESARVAAANALLDRGFGKPMQAIDHSSTDGSMMPTRIEITSPNDVS